MIVLVFPGVISFEVRGERIDEMFTQEMADLARRLAINTQLVDRLDTKTMKIRPKKGDRT